jgi:putative heme-binding domain-containing protein
MKLTACALAVLAIGLMARGAAFPSGLSAQAVPAPQAGGGRGQPSPPTRNPLEGNADAIRAGSGTYGSSCASCHGADAKGTARASDLTALWAEGGSDVQIFRSIRAGITNSLIPHSFGPDNTAWAVLAFLRSINADPGSARPAGNADNGMRAFEASCRTCHQVNGLGGRLGPALTRVGSYRSRSLLAQKIRHASVYIMVDYNGIENGYIADGYQPVTVVTRDGQRIRGAKKNEDTFSVQIMDTREQVQGYLQASLREFIDDTTSLMPDFGPDKLNERDLQDLLTYLGTLRGSGSAGR